MILSTFENIILALPWKIIHKYVKWIHGSQTKVTAVIELKNKCCLAQMDGWGDRELRMGTRYILEAETNRLGDALARRDERKAEIKNDS